MILFNKNIRINIDPNVVNHVEILLEYGMLELCKTVVIIINLVAKNVSTPVGSFSFLTYILVKEESAVQANFYKLRDFKHSSKFVIFLFLDFP